MLMNRNKKRKDKNDKSEDDEMVIKPLSMLDIKDHMI